MRIFCTQKNLFQELQLDQIMFLPNFSTATLKNNIKSEKMCQGFLFLILDLEKIIFLCFMCHAQKSSLTLFDQFELTRHLYGNPGHVFVQRLYFSACGKFQRIQKRFTKVGAKDKTLIRISVLQHIHHENRSISSAFNARRKQIISKTPKVTPVNINKTNEPIVLL